MSVSCDHLSSNSTNIQAYASTYNEILTCYTFFQPNTSQICFDWSAVLLLVKRSAQRLGCAIKDLSLYLRTFESRWTVVLVGTEIVSALLTTIDF